MPDRGRGFSFARGNNRFIEYRKPASAFSAGNVVMLDSNSSVSGINLTLAPDAYGIALTDSDKSLSDKVPIEVINPTNVYWAHTATNVASTYSVGSRWDYIASGGDHVVQSSATTVRLVIAEGGAQGDIDQSNESRVLVRFIGAGGELVYL